jgi:hypothetical protein
MDLRLTAFGLSTVAATACLVTVVAGPSIVAQQPACLHGSGETPEQLNRRRQAVQTARQINTEQARVFATTRGYRPAADLNVNVAPGFAMSLTTDGVTYKFALKDTLDACRFAFFSDQEGLIFEANPIR